MGPAVILSLWSAVSLVRLEMKNEIRLSPNKEGHLERNGCWTPSGLLTRFLWTTLIVGALWIVQCALTLNGNLWSNALIDTNDLENGEIDHNSDISGIITYFGLDLLSLIMLLILYYMLVAEMVSVNPIVARKGRSGKTEPETEHYVK